MRCNSPLIKMIQKISTGILFGALVGMLITTMFVSKGSGLADLFLTKITATSIITGFLCGIYAHFSKSKLQVFLISILIGALTFYVKYLITGHHFDPITMGAFVGAMLGGIFSLIRKLIQSVKIYRRLQRLKKRI